MRFKHQIWNDSNEVLAEKWFKNSFTPAAFVWFKIYALKHGYNRMVKDTTIAGHYYANEAGETLTLH
jgi:hypothetical protein